jgi:KEOPS complex subunit Cgi121
MVEDADETESSDLPPREDWSVVVEPRAVEVDDVDALLDAVRAAARAAEDAGGRAVAQAVDARYVASERHLLDAFAKALRATRRGENVADGLAMETLLYAAGTRQIDVATDIGPGEQTETVALVGATTGDADALWDALRAIGEDAADAFPMPDVDAVRAFYDVGDAELAAASGDGDAAATMAVLELLVRERVALLDVRK